MGNITSGLKSNNGAVMIILSTMLLILMTIISFSASKTASTEVQISRNDYLYQNNFYCAEGAVIEIVDKLEAEPTVEVDKFGWLMNLTGAVDSDSSMHTYWAVKDEDRGAQDARPANAAVCSEHTESMSVHHGVLPGSSLDMSKPTKHAYSIYGLSDHRGTVMIAVGYAKAF
jgi:hypothetical protein